MTPHLTALFDSVDIDAPLRGVANGAIPLPSPAFVAPFQDFGFPPACVPLWSERATGRYAALWLHPFGGRRSTFVTCDVADGYYTWEIARTARQLLIEVVANFLGHARLATAVERFAADVGVDVGRVRATRRPGVPYRHGLLDLPEFAADPPLSCFADEAAYPGDFPAGPAARLTPERARTWCGLEVTEPLGAQLLATGFAPLWFAGTGTPSLFERLIDAGDFAGAWCCLNSNGWTSAAAEGALARLADTSRDATLLALSVWRESRPAAVAFRY
ncbi:MAG TPA: hypothetical protein VEA69_13650 [Tepidisphaeraceae bacterium]|nr:hypothetical protein [Tepidisphaeraceae bacterium]